MFYWGILIRSRSEQQKIQNLPRTTTDAFSFAKFSSLDKARMFTKASLLRNKSQSKNNARGSMLPKMLQLGLQSTPI